TVAYVAIVRPIEFIPPSALREAVPQAFAQTPTIPTSVVAYFLLLLLVFVGGARLVARIFHERAFFFFGHRAGARSVLIVGAGDGGRLVLREVTRNPDLGLRPVGFIDDDPAKDGLRIDGVRVLGTTSDLARVL